MNLRLNFYSKIIKDINEWQEKNEYVDQVARLIYYNEIKKSAILKFVKFQFSQEILDKIEFDVQQELSQKYPSEIIDELSGIEDPLQRDLEKRKRMKNGEMIEKPFDISNVPIKEVNDTRKSKIQQYAITDKGNYNVVDIYIKFEEDSNGQIVSEIISENILTDIALIDL